MEEILYTDEYNYNGILIAGTNDNDIMESVNHSISVIGCLNDHKFIDCNPQTDFLNLYWAKRQKALLIYITNCDRPELCSEIKNEMEAASNPQRQVSTEKFQVKNINSLGLDAMENFNSYITICLTSPTKFAKDILGYFRNNTESPQFFAYVTFPSIYSFFVLPELRKVAFECINEIFKLYPVTFEANDVQPSADKLSVREFLVASMFLQFPGFISTLWESYFFAENSICDSKMSSIKTFLDSLKIAAHKLTSELSEIAKLMYKNEGLFASTIIKLVFLPSLEIYIKQSERRSTSGGYIRESLNYLLLSQKTAALSCIAHILTFSSHNISELEEISYGGRVGFADAKLILSLPEAKTLLQMVKLPVNLPIDLSKLSSFKQFTTSAYFKFKKPEISGIADFFSEKYINDDYNQCWDLSCMCIFKESIDAKNCRYLSAKDNFELIRKSYYDKFDSRITCFEARQILSNEEAICQRESEALRMISEISKR